MRRLDRGFTSLKCWAAKISRLRSDGSGPVLVSVDVDANPTTFAVQSYLDELAGVRGQQPAEPIVRELLAHSARRLQVLCASMLKQSYPRLTRPPVNLRTDEMLGAVVERLLKALREIHPRTVGEFFALANRHMRWELNEIARQLDQRPPVVELQESIALAPPSTHSGLSLDARHILDAIDRLPEEEREVFGLVRIQGLMHAEVAGILCISTKTVQRRLNRSLVLLAESVHQLRGENSSRGDR